MADKDYFDRIADALQIISGDDSHVDDVNKNMDYYKRIAEALQNIATSSSKTGPLIVHADISGMLDKTWAEMRNAYFAVIVFDNGLHVYVDYPAEYVESSNSCEVITTGGVTYIATTRDGYPVMDEG